MVLANNEWRNNSKDVQFTATATNVAATTTTTTSTGTTASAAATTAIGSAIPTTATGTAAVGAATTDIANDNDDAIRHNQQFQRQQLHSIVSTPMMTAKKLQIMLENTDPDYSDVSIELSNATITDHGNTNSNSSSDNAVDSNESDNNNLQLCQVINDANMDEDFKEQSLSNCSSVSNTLTNCNYKQLHVNDNADLPIVAASNINMRFKTTPITQQALSNALQTALNSNVQASPTPISNGNNGSSSYLSSLCLSSKTPQNNNNSNNLLEQNNSNGSTNFASADCTSTQELPAICDNNGQAKIVLLCEANSHPFHQRTILLTPNIECKVGRLIAKSKAAETNAIFDCKVLSRNHAVLWYSDDGKFWVKDTKSSNGTFINDNKLGNDAAELHFGDVVKFGVDVLENSRKEVHGCIIACVKLYMPDGREAISIVPTTSLRSMYSGERSISFDEMHRINLYMQELSQREKVLKGKLNNLQTVLENMRENAAMNWQAYINEDQLLHRIGMQEKKLQIMEKNTSESALRNEVIKLMEEKNAYQLATKEALRKVYNERCEAFQLLSKAESSYAITENECKILRDQIMSSKHAMQDINARLLLLESEYNEYREEQQLKMQEAKAEAEQTIADISIKFQQSADKCQELKTRVDELTKMLERKQLEQDEQTLQMQAVEKLDAVIADMEFGDSDEYDNDDDDDEVDEADAEACELNAPPRNGRNNKTKIKTISKAVTNFKNAQNASKQNKAESTIMKWLQNSDLNKKEGSHDIFHAICNESDSSDENDMNAMTNAAAAAVDASSKAKLEHVQQCLEKLQEQLQAEETQHVDDAQQLQSTSQAANGLSTTASAAALQTNYGLIKQSYVMLREVQQQLQAINAAATTCKPNSFLYAHSAVPANMRSSSGGGIKKLETQLTLKSLPEAILEEHQEEEADYEAASSVVALSNNEQLHLEKQLSSYKEKMYKLNEQLETTQRDSQHTLEIMQFECDNYKAKVDELNLLTSMLKSEKQELEQVIKENKANAQKMQQEVDYRNAQDIIEETIEDAMHKVSKETLKNVSVADSLTREEEDVSSFDQQMREEVIAMNSTAMQREEELIVYKERLEEMQQENLQLQQQLKNSNNIANAGNGQMQMILHRFLPYGVVIVAFFTYFMATYRH